MTALIDEKDTAKNNGDRQAVLRDRLSAHGHHY